MTASNAASSTDVATAQVVVWILSRPVLARWLRSVVLDPAASRDREQDLACTMSDLLDPDRDWRWADIMHALGVGKADADALWVELDDKFPGWVNHVDWGSAMEALLEPERQG